MRANKKTPQPEWLTTKQFGELTQFDDRTIIENIKKGTIPALKFGREYRIHRSFLDQFKPATISQNQSAVWSVSEMRVTDAPQPTKTTKNNT